MSGIGQDSVVCGVNCGCCIPNIEELYDEMLDDCNPMVKIGNLEYSPSRVLKEVDPIAYRCGMNDYESALLEETCVEGEA